MMTFVLNQWRKRRKKKAFTLLEMLLVLFIIAALLLLVLPNLIAQQDHVNAKTDKAFQTMLQNQVVLYQSDNNGKIPEHWTDLGDGKGNDDYLSKEQIEKATKKYKIVNGEVVLIEGNGAVSEENAA
ncbi:MAG: prepilin-type N-terminal cleavage/methylation domain-containing protein [Schleiferilactobacillus perolens]|uniref:prepilin-type N-terminal cleavage/methylation domain-containing protein n=1 Tax=Schleiferilactobacillus perolens TaxID=100468 RepID=UPI0039E9A5A7|nr:prepilin-type N-terminal cleavage/methylation domain-containing protein [Schleiferilactobacillus harbinensis]MCI1911843.1 prepilin-type N-terminal cleavage/methylation domain-containing protein [Schleiferilactobacillus harbinensis]